MNKGLAGAGHSRTVSWTIGATMDEINKAVKAARQRVMWNYFLRIIAWTLLTTLLLIAVGIAVPKLWHLPFLDAPEAANFWIAGWTIGGAVAGLMLAAVLTVLRRQSLLNVAVEVDQRFGLKSRLSSTLAMSPDDHSTDAGAALAEDAAKEASKIDVRDEFKIETPWQLCLPLLAALLVFGLLFIPNATSEAASSKTDISQSDDREKVKTAVEQLKKKIREKRVSTGLKDAELDFEKFELSLDEVDKNKSVSKKQALVKLNDLKKQIEERQKKLGSTKSFKDALNKLKDIGDGPAKQLADAMKKGDMVAAKKAIKSLAKRLKEGKLTKDEQARLKKDLEKMAEQMKAMAKAQRQKKDELEKQIAKAKQEGNFDKAARLQEKLEQVKKQDNQAKKMKEMAKKLAKCAQCMKKGGGDPQQQGQPGQSQKSPSEAEAEMQEAAEQMEDLAKQLEDMQMEMEELEDMEDMQQAIDDAKAEMNGQPCDCPGGEEGEPGEGMGEGNGTGRRPKEDNQTGNFKSRVRGKLQKGKIVVAGTADGENLTGRTTAEARQIINAEMNSKKETVENQLLPKSQREHTREYFQSLLKGQ